MLRQSNNVVSLHLQTLLDKSKESEDFESQYNMSSKIKHSGIVESVGADCVHVRILQSSACAACKVAAHCNASEAKEKTIDVYDPRAGRYRPGQRVVLTADASVGHRATLYGYVFPLLVMVGVLVGVLGMGGSEVEAALCSVGALLPYYLVVYLLRARIGRRLTFTLEAQSD